MGVGTTFAEAYRKAQLGASDEIPSSGSAFLSVREVDKDRLIPIAQSYKQLGFDLVATRGTAQVIEAAGIQVITVNKVSEGRPHIVDMIKNGEINLILNTTEGRAAIADSSEIRSSAEAKGVYYTTTIAGGEAVSMALTSGMEDQVHRLQDLHQGLL